MFKNQYGTTGKSLLRHNGATFSTQFLNGIFAARAVVNWRSRPLAKPLYCSRTRHKALKNVPASGLSCPYYNLQRIYQVMVHNRLWSFCSPRNGTSGFSHLTKICRTCADKLPLCFAFPYLVRKFNSVIHHGVRHENADFKLTQTAFR